MTTKTTSIVATAVTSSALQFFNFVEREDGSLDSIKLLQLLHELGEQVSLEEVHEVMDSMAMYLQPQPPAVQPLPCCLCHAAAVVVEDFATMLPNGVCILMCDSEPKGSLEYRYHHGAESAHEAASNLLRYYRPLSCTSAGCPALEYAVSSYRIAAAVGCPMSAKHRVRTRRSMSNNLIAGSETRKKCRNPSSELGPNEQVEKERPWKCQVLACSLMFTCIFTIEH